ncbi:adhesion G protein-coupled receptor E2-like [Saccostrea echinata]|uniref:adhesion G protein-coupled receptor E2-like n=1 Tax=Saccostrea echinata TaxID=191078 RepID=UPI002A826500|nr:adhesion G protein-coupled receptor E2-like [Saccostrea echinata]
MANFLLMFTKNFTVNDSLVSKHLQIKLNSFDSNAFKTLSSKPGRKKYFLRRKRPPPVENNVTYWQHCPKIYLPASYHLNHCDFEICITEYDVCFESHIAKFEQEDTAIALCLDDYKRIINDYVRRTTGEDSPETYFSVICLSVSSIGCLLTVTKSLVSLNTASTLPTPLNIKMTLSFTLFLANTFYTASRFFTYLYPVCMVLGIASHYLWLLVLSFMTTLCFDLFLTTFRVFKSRRSNNFLTYFVANVTFGLVVVAIHIRLSYGISGGSCLGYSKTTCFIENGILKFFTLILPISLMVFLNTVLVFVTIFCIKKKMSFSNSQDTQILKIYFKLSTATGMTWIFGLLYEVLELPFFSHIHSLFNGCIGMFIFAAFGYQIDT